MSSRLKWLMVIQLLLSEHSLCRVPPPLSGDSQLPGAEVYKDAEEAKNQDHPPLLKPLELSLMSPERSEPQSQREERIRSARMMTSILQAKLPEKIPDHLHTLSNVSCEELLSVSMVDDLLPSAFPQELLGLSLMPVLVVAGCPREAQILVMKLYDLLGVADTDELLMQVEGLMGGRKSKSAVSHSRIDEEGPHMDAVMYNIQQLAVVGEGPSGQEVHCDGWNRVNGTILVGKVIKGAMGELKEAVSHCERLGVQCAGVSSTGPLTPGLYQAVLKTGSRILPSETAESECWIRQCGEDVWTAGGRVKRSPQRSCNNMSEQQVYNVVEWIPGVSTLYNLGTAVYYASVNCTETAKERAIHSAVDLGTDALLVATGGTAGVAGYALGAGMKTGVKAGVRYLLGSMKGEDDLLVNQASTEDGIFTVQ